MAMSGGRDDGEPMMEMNTTPLIDVMLVLLIMFIITIPVQTHAVKIDLPRTDQPPPPPDAIKPDINKLGIMADNSILWNGTPVDAATLKDYLERTKVMTLEPELHFQPDPEARFNIVDYVLAIIKKSEVTKMGFVGNEKFSGF
jgi:biopolymer transport protein ExbD